MTQEKKDARKVRFNVAIGAHRDHPGYRHNQVVNYADMPPGHRFWADNKSILGSSMICEFIEEEPLPEKTPAKPEIVEKEEPIAQQQPESETKETKQEEDPLPEKAEKQKPVVEKKKRGRPKKDD